MIARYLVIPFCVICSPIVAAELTHGPVIGHTTPTSTRIWIRADAACQARVRVVPLDGSTNPIQSTSVDLRPEDNYCRAIEVRGLIPRTAYRYRVQLDGVEQATSLDQRFRTFPFPNQRGVVRIGFGHSLRGEGDQTTWTAVATKKPDVFILMGDNIYSNTTEPDKQRNMYLAHRADHCFRALAATTPMYAVWDDHDYGANNSDRDQPGKERSLKTFHEIWPNPPSQAGGVGGIWTRFTLGSAEFFLLDVRYHRSPNSDPDGPRKTMLGAEQRRWLLNSVSESEASFKFLVSGSSWNCGGVEAWNHQFTHEYDSVLEQFAANRISGIILLGGDQHYHKIGVRPRESWGGYDLHEWMAGQLWSTKRDQQQSKNTRGFGLITVDTTVVPAVSRLEFFDEHGARRLGRRIPYTTPGAWRALWDSPSGVSEQPPRSMDGELRPATCGSIWESLPATSGETLSEEDLRFPDID